MEVVAAVIHQEGRFLCTQRGEHRYGYLSKKFEFPGGKTEAGERVEDALVREIREELAMEIRPVRHLISVSHSYPDFNLNLHAWLCSCHSMEFVLHEHISACWLPAKELSQLDWAAADLPVAALLHSFPDI